MFALFALLAVAAEPGAVDATTTLGAQGVWSAALADGDADALLSERARWTLPMEGSVTGRADLNGHFRVSPLRDVVLERSRLRALSVTLDGPGWTAVFGRQAVMHGGARLVDGVQVVARPGDWSIGAWAGEAPDWYTTLPTPRFGGGPVLAYDGPLVQASVVGEALFAAGGLDHAGAIAHARVGTPDKSLAGRLDVQQSGLVDGSVFGRISPTPSLDLDAFYDAYTSVRYLTTADRDPAIRRFDARAQSAVETDIPQDAMDPTLYHLVGASVRVAPDTSALNPTLTLRGRYRHHAEADRRMVRFDPRFALTGLAGARLDLGVEGDVIRSDLAWRGEMGPTLRVELGRERTFGFEALGGVMFDEAFGGKPGMYGDLFVDWFISGGWILLGGVEVLREPRDEFTDVGWAGFLSVSKRVSARPRASHDASGP